MHEIKNISCQGTTIAMKIGQLQEESSGYGSRESLQVGLLITNTHNNQSDVAVTQLNDPYTNTNNNNNNDNNSNNNICSSERSSRKCSSNKVSITHSPSNTTRERDNSSKKVSSRHSVVTQSAASVATSVATSVEKDVMVNQLISQNQRLMAENHTLSEELHISRRFFEGTLRGMRAQLIAAESKLKILQETISTYEEVSVQSKVHTRIPTQHRDNATRKTTHVEKTNNLSEEKRLPDEINTTQQPPVSVVGVRKGRRGSGVKRNDRRSSTPSPVLPASLNTSVTTTTSEMTPSRTCPTTTTSSTTILSTPTTSFIATSPTISITATRSTLSTTPLTSTPFATPPMISTTSLTATPPTTSTTSFSATSLTPSTSTHTSKTPPSITTPSITPPLTAPSLKLDSTFKSRISSLQGKNMKELLQKENQCVKTDIELLKHKAAMRPETSTNVLTSSPQDQMTSSNEVRRSESTGSEENTTTSKKRSTSVESSRRKSRGSRGSSLERGESPRRQPSSRGSSRERKKGEKKAKADIRVASGEVKIKSSLMSYLPRDASLTLEDHKEKLTEEYKEKSSTVEASDSTGKEEGDTSRNSKILENKSKPLIDMKKMVDVPR